MASSTDGVMFTRDSAKLIAEVVRRERGRLAPRTKVSRRNDIQSSYKCKLSSTLASGSFTSPQSCTVTVWTFDPSGSTSPPALVATTETELTNLSATSYLKLNSSAPSGTPARIEWSDCGWEIVYVEWC